MIKLIQAKNSSTEGMTSVLLFDTSAYVALFGAAFGQLRNGKRLRLHKNCFTIFTVFSYLRGLFQDYERRNKR